MIVVAHGDRKKVKNKKEKEIKESNSGYFFLSFY